MKKLAYVFLGGFAVLAIEGVIYWVFSCWVYWRGETGLSVLNNLIVFFTLVVIIYYTYETTKLREEAQKQNITAIRPVVIPYPAVYQGDKDGKIALDENGEPVSLLPVINKGRGLALNIYLLIWNKNEEKFIISKPENTPRALAPLGDDRDKFNFTIKLLKELEPKSIIELLPYASKLIKIIPQKKEDACCCIYSDLEDREYYTILYGMTLESNVGGVDAGRIEIGKLY